MTYHESEPKKDHKKHRTPEVPEPKEGAYLPSLSDTVASTDCTGLIPTPPSNEGEMESYQELSSMSLPEDTETSAQE